MLSHTCTCTLYDVPLLRPLPVVYGSRQAHAVCVCVCVLVAQLQLREAELRSCRHQLSAVEGDLALAEQEKDNLQRKVEVLQRALESPGSRLALRRILERWCCLPQIIVLMLFLSCLPAAPCQTAPPTDPRLTTSEPARCCSPPHKQSRVCVCVCVCVKGRGIWKVCVCVCYVLSESTVVLSM